MERLKKWKVLFTTRTSSGEKQEYAMFVVGKDIHDVLKKSEAYIKDQIGEIEHVIWDVGIMDDNLFS